MSEERADDRLSRFDAATEPFPCQEGCTGCCRGVLSLSLPELQRIETFLGGVPEPVASVGCPFRRSGGCAVYAVRPFMCRLFGFRYVHPGLRGQSFCPRDERWRPGDREAEMFAAYRSFCHQEGFVLLGRTDDPVEGARAGADNRAMLEAFPELARWKAFLTGVIPARRGDRLPVDHPAG
ncbi:MAG: hypothetical protein OZSIB_3599 [Candidatus Ozemobacter sibiricus]|jgi:Fe-S-cluster containining protein|uniref:YkgJ family cysteine cluster protein n=1 Tax=Candidatus Ozemobacter sibiricus TaxID=2268124 RepID=A0A367ZPM8_9BACT|nr:MAG: hypothetical protein OZSIB_3599 [Candidatus Ozemobacter sibiricus]